MESKHDTEALDRLKTQVSKYKKIIFSKKNKNPPPPPAHDSLLNKSMDVSTKINSKNLALPQNLTLKAKKCSQSSLNENNSPRNIKKLSGNLL